MTTRSEREKAQKLNEQHQAILSKLLREDDNKYCADCEAKGATTTLSDLLNLPTGLPQRCFNNLASVIVSSAPLTCLFVTGSGRSADISSLKLNKVAN